MANKIVFVRCFDEVVNTDTNLDTKGSGVMILSQHVTPLRHPLQLTNHTDRFQVKYPGYYWILFGCASYLQRGAHDDDSCVELSNLDR